MLCNNTGFRLRSGRSCKPCWRTFNDVGFRIPFTKLSVQRDFSVKSHYFELTLGTVCWATSSGVRSVRRVRGIEVRHVCVRCTTVLVQLQMVCLSLVECTFLCLVSCSTD